MFAVSSLKEQIIWLGNIAINSFIPESNSAHPKELRWNDAGSIRFDAEQQLFKPLGRDRYDDALKRLLHQQLGFEVRDNLQFQWELTRYRTLDAQREVEVKLGVHFDFR